MFYLHQSNPEDDCYFEKSQLFIYHLRMVFEKSVQYLYKYTLNIAKSIAYGHCANRTCPSAKKKITLLSLNSTLHICQKISLFGTIHILAMAKNAQNCRFNEILSKRMKTNAMTKWDENKICANFTFSGVQNKISFPFRIATHNGAVVI